MGRPLVVLKFFYHPAVKLAERRRFSSLELPDQSDDGVVPLEQSPLRSRDRCSIDIYSTKVIC